MLTVLLFVLAGSLIVAGVALSPLGVAGALVAAGVLVGAAAFDLTRPDPPRPL